MVWLRTSYLKEDNKISEQEEEKLIEYCINEIKNKSKFYQEWDELFTEIKTKKRLDEKLLPKKKGKELDEYYLLLNMKCIRKYEKKRKIKLQW